MTDDERTAYILDRWGPTLALMAKGDPPTEDDITATVAHMRKMRDEIVFLRGALREARAKALEEAAEVAQALWPWMVAEELRRRADAARSPR